MKFLEKEAKGITLISLVVTIVVLIILATVSINLVLGENGIIGQAQKAKEYTRGASAKEEIDIWKMNIEADKLTNSTIAESKEDLLDRLVENGTLTQEESDKLANKETITIGKSEISLDGTAGSGTGDSGVNPDDTIDLTSLAIGDYVNYTYDTEDSEGNALTYSLLSTQSGYDDDQTVAQSATTLKWRVLNIDEENGTIDLVSADSTDNEVYFQGALGYNNGVYLLNDICEKLYSNSALGIKARSINLEDTEKHLTEAGFAERNAYTLSNTGIQYGGVKTYTGSKAYYPNLYAQQNGSGINTTTVKTNGIGESDNYYSTPTTETYSQAVASGLTVTSVAYFNITFNETNYGAANVVLKSDKDYWVATRVQYSEYNVADGSYADFGLRSASDSVSSRSLYQSVHDDNFRREHLRPLVTFNVRLLDGTKDAYGTWNLKTNLE